MARRRETLREWQRLAAGVALVITAVIAWDQAWPFDGAELVLSEEPSLAQLLLADPLTRGFARLAIMVLVLYAVASMPALVVAGRWIKGLKTSGVDVDEAYENAPKMIMKFEAWIDELIKERDEYKREAESCLGQPDRDSLATNEKIE